MKDRTSPRKEVQTQDQLEEAAVAGDLGTNEMSYFADFGHHHYLTERLVDVVVRLSSSPFLHITVVRIRLLPLVTVELTLGCRKKKERNYKTKKVRSEMNTYSAGSNGAFAARSASRAARALSAV